MISLLTAFFLSAGEANYWWWLAWTILTWYQFAGWFRAST